MSVTAFPVPGKVTLWLDRTADPGLATTVEDTIGMKITNPAAGRAFFYIPGCAAIPADLAQRLSGSPLVLFDGTTWTDDELPAAGIGVNRPIAGLLLPHECADRLRQSGGPAGRCPG